MSNNRNSFAGVTLDSVIKWSAVPSGLWIFLIIQAAEKKNYDLATTLVFLLPVVIALVALLIWIAQITSRAFNAWQRNRPERERRRQEARVRAAEHQKIRRQERANYKQHRQEIARQRALCR